MRTSGYFSAKRWLIPASRHQAQVIIMPVVRRVPGGGFIFSPQILKVWPPGPMITPTRSRSLGAVR